MNEGEKQTLSEMVTLYCRRKEGNHTLCRDCAALIDYAHCRLEHCRHGSDKPSCRHCQTHCYTPLMRERIRAVMRYSGPRMLLYHPLSIFTWLRHI